MISFSNFIANHANELGLKTLEQLYLVGLAMGVALCIGLPTGILINRFSALRPFMISITNIIQTIPSLALFAFLIPFTGIGIKPAIITLMLYALLPIVRNTLSGLNNIPEHYLEAADALGFTHWQRLRRVELPLASPVIVAGIRTATVMCAGIATLATFIGAGGLGDFINRGLSLNDNRLILLGAIPAAILALLLDASIGFIEKKLTKQRKTTRKKHFKKWLFLFASLVPIAIFFAWPNEKRNTITIATKNFSEEFVLGEILSQIIEANTSLHITKKFNLSSSKVCHEAMLRGDVDIYPEYTGTAYLVILHQQAFESAEQVYQDVKDAYAKKFKIIWLNPFGFANQQTLGVKKSFAKKWQLRNISDLIPLQDKLTIGVGPEFIGRPDAKIGLEKRYHLYFNDIRILDPGLIHPAIDNGGINILMAFTTDPKNALSQLTLLNDDKHLFPPYYAAPLIREEVLKKYPEIATALKPLAGRIDNKTMLELNYKVDILHQSARRVACEFLNQQKLIITQCG